MKQFLIAAIISIAVAGSGIALAQDAPAATSGTNSSSSSTDALQFASKARVGDLFEVESSALARSKTKDSDIAAFAQMMIKDHGKADAELTATAERDGANGLPAELDADKSEQYRQLVLASGVDFDRLYMKLQAQAHAEAVALFSGYVQNGPPGLLKKFATETLPKLRTHSAMVQQLGG